MKLLAYHQQCSKELPYGVLAEMSRPASTPISEQQGGETMNKSLALTTAINLAKTVVSSNGIQNIPDKICANALADFIETLAERLEKMDPES